MEITIHEPSYDFNISWQLMIEKLVFVLLQGIHFLLLISNLSIKHYFCHHSKWLFLRPWLHRIWNIKFKLKFPYHTYMSVCNQIQIVHLIRWFFYFFSIFYYAILITLNLQLSLKQDLKVMPKQFWLGQGVPKNAQFLTALLYV